MKPERCPLIERAGEVIACDAPFASILACLQREIRVCQGCAHDDGCPVKRQLREEVERGMHMLVECFGGE
jgi:hypothetical protein